MLVDMQIRQWAPSSEIRYLDPCLAWSPRQYSRFGRDLRSRGHVVFGRWCVEEAGFFLVRTKNNKLHLILGARRANTKFLLPHASRVGECGRVEPDRA